MSERIQYLAGQRKRKRIGTVQEVKEIAGQKLYRIVKHWKESWIKQDDIVETKTETRQSNLDANGGGIEAESKSGIADQSDNSAQEGPGGVKVASQTVEGIQQASPGLASGEALRVSRGGSGGQADMFPEITSRKPGSPQKRTRQGDAQPNGVLDWTVPPQPSMDRCEPERGVCVGVDRAKMELANLNTRDEIEAWRKRAIRNAKGGKSLEKYAAFFYGRARMNDAKFFIRIGKALQERKTKKPKPLPQTKI